MNRRLFAVCVATAALALCLPAGVAGSWFAAPAAAAATGTTRDVCGWDVPWAEMTGAEQADWLRLGWTAQMWDSNDDNAYPETETMLFNDLSVDQRGAAEELGFNQDTWDNIDKYCGGDSGGD